MEQATITVKLILYQLSMEPRAATKKLYDTVALPPVSEMVPS